MRCVTVGATTWPSDTSTRAASRVNSPAKVMTSLEKVAENISVWRVRGSAGITFRSGGRKPMSSIRSASSSVRISIADRSIVRCFM